MLDYHWLLPTLQKTTRLYSLPLGIECSKKRIASNHTDWYGRSGECERIINGQTFCEQHAVLERLKIDVTIDGDGTCSDWSFSDSNDNRVRLMEDWCSSSNAHHNAGERNRKAKRMYVKHKE